MKALENRYVTGVHRALRRSAVLLAAVSWGVGTARGQTSPDVVEVWSSEVLRTATRKAEQAERVVQLSERLEELSAGSPLSPAEWPTAYATLLERRAEALRALSPNLMVSSADKDPNEESAVLPDASPHFGGTARFFRAPEMARLIRRILRQEGLPEQLVAVALIESGFNPLAESPKGARGLWQLMPDTARHFGLNPDGPFDERLDPVRSTVAAACYLRQLYSLWGDWRLTLAAYNASPGRVQEALARSGARSFFAAARLRLLPEETQRYVPKVLAAARRVSPSESIAGRSLTFLGTRPTYVRTNAELREGGAP